MITYQDCPNCGARKIHSTVRLCEVCETWERAEQALNAQDEVLTAKYNQQLARAEKAEKERDEARVEVVRLREALAKVSLDEYESTSSASEKVHGHARIAREALYGKPAK